MVRSCFNQWAHTQVSLPSHDALGPGSMQSMSVRDGQEQQKEASEASNPHPNLRSLHLEPQGILFEGSGGVAKNPCPRHGVASLCLLMCMCNLNRKKVPLPPEERYLGPLQPKADFCKEFQFHKKTSVYTVTAKPMTRYRLDVLLYRLYAIHVGHTIYCM